MTNNIKTRIWITDREYIDVADNGHVDTWYEGALGCVIPIISNGTTVAMKLPRLLADTLQENMYIHHLAEVEAEAVYAVTRSVGSPYLLPALGSADDLRGRRNFNYLSDGREEQQGCTLLFSFEKGKSPRLCTFRVAKDADGKPDFFVVPQALKEEMTTLLRDSNVADKIAPKHLGPRNEALYVTNRPETNLDRHGILSEAVGTYSQLTTWYSQLPSIKYPWADMTLQEALNDGKLGAWDINEHAEMLNCILEALKGLHEHRILHGDIRPANIMCANTDAAKPKAYRLSDYGSFSSREILGTQANNPTGNTSVGTFIGRHRSSSFYAPERREAVESEAANVAIVIRYEDHFIVHLGWRRNLLEKSTLVSSDQGNTAETFSKSPKESVVEALRSIASKFQPMDKPSASDVGPSPLRPGDKLRVRDYLFEVVHVVNNAQSPLDGHGDGYLTCVCSAHVGRIFNDRMTIYNNGDPSDVPQVIGLPNFVVFRQWSAATDLYSFGALCLYCLLATAIQNRGQEEGDQVKARVDEHFSEMMMVLESESYFRVIWGELEEVRGELEALSGADPSGVQPNKIATDKGRFEGNLPEDQKTVGRLAEMTLNNICVNTPHFGIIVKRHFDSNSALVVLFMHFVMSCLHRKENLKSASKKDNEVSESSSTRVGRERHLPFALDRAEQPKPDGAVARAAERFGQLQMFLQEERFAAFRVATIPDFSLQSDVDVRIDLKKLELKVEDMNNFYRSELDRIEKAATTESSSGMGRAKAAKIHALIAELQAAGKKWEAPKAPVKQ